MSTAEVEAAADDLVGVRFWFREPVETAAAAEEAAEAPS